MDDMDYAALSVETREDFVRFMRQLLEYWQEWPEEWTSTDIPSYLAAIASVVEPTTDWLAAGGEAQVDMPSWKTVAFVLRHATNADRFGSPEPRNQ